KTVAFEIWEQLAGRVPDVAVAPVGDGPTLVALADGFDVLRTGGLTDRVPRILGVQAERCQPLVRRWKGLPEQRTADPTDTIADGIKVREPALGDRAVRTVVKTAGAFVAVSDDD